PSINTMLINAGGPVSGSYGADNSFAGGSTFSHAAATDLSSASNPAPANVYQTERTGTAFSYVLSGFATGATQTVRLHFAEIWWTAPAKRSFNVAINGTTVLSNFDIF